MEDINTSFILNSGEFPHLSAWEYFRLLKLQAQKIWLSSCRLTGTRPHCFQMSRIPGIEVVTHNFFLCWNFKFKFPFKHQTLKKIGCSVAQIFFYKTVLVKMGANSNESWPHPVHAGDAQVFQCQRGNVYSEYCVSHTCSLICNLLPPPDQYLLLHVVFSWTSNTCIIIPKSTQLYVTWIMYLESCGSFATHSQCLGCSVKWRWLHIDHKLENILFVQNINWILRYMYLFKKVKKLQQLHVLWMGKCAQNA